MNTELADAIDRVNQHFKMAYRCTLDDVEIADTPGYWRHKKPCGGLAGGCREPIHQCLFNEAPIKHTLRYTDRVRKPNGQFKSPYETWRIIKLAEVHNATKE